MSKNPYFIKRPKTFEPLGKSACTDYPTSVFYPHSYDTETTQLAKQICAMCPNREPCLEYALRANESAGIWSSTSPKDRRRIKAKRAREGTI